MEPTIKEALLEYEELKLSIKEKEERLEELKPILLKVVPQDKEVESKFGFFTLKSRSKWRYSTATTTMEETLKELQKKEKADGTAQELPGTPYIEYRVKE